MATKKSKVNKMADIQKQVCADILRTGDVIKSDTLSSIISQFSNKLDKTDLRNLKHKLDAAVDKQTGGLVERVIRETQK